MPSWHDKSSLILDDFHSSILANLLQYYTLPLNMIHSILLHKDYHTDLKQLSLAVYLLFHLLLPQGLWFLWQPLAASDYQFLWRPHQRSLSQCVPILWRVLLGLLCGSRKREKRHMSCLIYFQVIGPHYSPRSTPSRFIITRRVASGKFISYTLTSNSAISYRTYIMQFWQR